MKLDVGIKFLLEFAAMPDKITTSLVGFEKDGYFILKVPPVAGLRGRLREGNKVVARFLHQGTIVSFRTEIVAVLTKPATLLFLAYPYGFETHLVRRHKRVNCFFPATASIDGWGVQGLIMDISAGGCRLTVDEADLQNIATPTLGAPLSITFHMLDRSVRYALDGTIVNLTPEDRKLSVGVSFSDQDEMTARVRTMLQEYLEEIKDALTEAQP